MDAQESGGPPGRTQNEGISGLHISRKSCFVVEYQGSSHHAVFEFGYE